MSQNAELQKWIHESSDTAIFKTYSGKAHACCCGCAGTYSENEASVLRLVRRLMSADPKALEFGEDYVALLGETRVNILYREESK